MPSTKVQRTFDYQTSLPSLPLPKLEDSCQKYLEAIKPFLNDEDFQSTCQKVIQFENGVGRKLQSKLEEKAANSRNWLKDIWYDTYLSYRGPLPVFSNPGCGIEPTVKFQPEDGSQVRRCALWLYNAAKVYRSLLKQDFPIQYLSKHVPLDMLQYVRFFCSGRIPDEPKDRRVHYIHLLPKDDGTTDVVCNVKHVVVFCGGRIFKVNIFDEDWTILTPPKIEKQLYLIKEKCARVGPGQSISWLTTGNRFTWSKAYKHMCELDDQNKTNIDVINEAIIGITLEDVNIYSLQESTELALLGDGGNRWFDKASEIFSLNGMIVASADHVHCDGNVGVSIMQQVLDFMEQTDYKWKGCQDLDKESDTEPLELTFIIDHVILEAIETSKVTHRKTISLMSVYEKKLCFGKDYAKVHGVSPDTLVQMVIQMAYYKKHKKCASVYESGTTRMFYNGRTETVRSCTVEVNNWMKSMLDQNQNDMKTKKRLLIRAMKKHDVLMKEACSGQGFDRHFYALQKMAEEEGLSTLDMFSDKAWKLSGGDGFMISSSLSGYLSLHGGIAPLNEDGYGMFYTIDPHKVNMIMTEFKASNISDCESIYQIMLDCFDDIDKLLCYDVSKL